MWAILLVTLGLGASDPVLGEGRYHSKAECDSFVEFVAIQQPQLPYFYDGHSHSLVDTDGTVFTATCVPVEE